MFNESRTIDAAGCDIVCHEAGAGDPLLILHGAGGPHVLPVHEQLAASRRVILVDLPGFGASPRCERIDTLAAMADAVASAAAALEIDAFALLGTSFGGAVALWLAKLHPERLTELILESPIAFPPDGGITRLEPEQLERALSAHPERRPPTPAPDPGKMDAQVELVERLMAASDPAELAAALPGLEVPMMVMFGTEDGLVPPELGRQYKALDPSCDFVLVYDAAHEIATDRPEAYLELVLDFLERREGHVVSRRSTLINP
jgi:pimeloyl-ACP methyl ester carboxylesterase